MLHRTGSLIGAIVLMTSCQVVREFKYSPPDRGPSFENERVVSSSFDDTWKALIATLGKTFFAIDAFEKESGLITLKFSAAPFSNAVSGGHCTFHFDNSDAVDWQFAATGIWGKKVKADFDGDYADYVEVFLNGQFEGRMNVVVASISPNKTQITVNARYVVIATVPGTATAVERTTWAWNSGEECRKFVTTADGKREPRVMRSSGRIEGEILDTIDTLFEGQAAKKP